MSNTNIMILLPPAPKGPGMINSPPLDVAKLLAILKQNLDLRISLSDLRKDLLRDSSFYQQRGIDLNVFNDLRRCLKHLLTEDIEISRMADRILSETNFDGIQCAIFSVSVCEQFPLPLLISSACLAKRIKEKLPKMKIIFFGNCPAAHVEKIKRIFKFIDIFPPAGNEFYIADYIQGLINGKKSKVLDPKNVGKVDFDNSPLADFSPLDLESYQSNGRLVLPYELNKGCINRCFFCYYILKGKVYLKDPNKAVADLITLSRQYGTNRFHITDAAVNMDPDWLMTFCDVLGRQQDKVKWCALAIPNLSPFMLDKLKRAGCVQLRLGVETGSERMLKKINKGTTKESIRNTLKYAHSIGINNYITLISGLPGELESDIEETKVFIQEIAPYVDSAQECIYGELGPFPLTVFEPRAKKVKTKRQGHRYKDTLQQFNVGREDIIDYLAGIRSDNYSPKVVI